MMTFEKIRDFGLSKLDTLLKIIILKLATVFNRKKLCGFKSYVIKNQESIDIIDILHCYENSTSRWYEG